jgi:hypothetical protein
VLPALALPSSTLAFSYILAFGVGTLLGMTGFSAGIGWMASRFSTGTATVYHAMTTFCAVAAIVVGSVWLVI